MGCYGDAAKGDFDIFFLLEIKQIHFLGAFEISAIKSEGGEMGQKIWSFSEKINQGEQSEASKGGEIAVVRRFMGSSSVHCLLYFSHTLVGRVVRVDFRCHS